MAVRIGLVPDDEPLALPMLLFQLAERGKFIAFFSPLIVHHLILPFRNLGQSYSFIFGVHFLFLMAGTAGFANDLLPHESTSNFDRVLWQVLHSCLQLREHSVQYFFPSANGLLESLHQMHWRELGHLHSVSSSDGNNSSDIEIEVPEPPSAPIPTIKIS